MCIVQIFCLLLLIIFPVFFEEDHDYQDSWWLVIVLMVNQFAIAVCQTIIDGMMVHEIRKDQKYGSSDILFFSWICMCIGGLYCNLSSSFLGTVGYHYNFCFPLTITIAMLIASLWISEEIDGNARQVMDMTFTTRLKFNLK
jgi:hypothetical protein